jgi:hypothetical protein
MSVRELTPEQALARLRAGALLIDVRAEHERALGMAEGARGIERTQLESTPQTQLPDPNWRLGRWRRQAIANWRLSPVA